MFLLFNGILDMFINSASTPNNPLLSRLSELLKGEREALSDDAARKKRDVDFLTDRVLEAIAKFD